VFFAQRTLDNQFKFNQQNALISFLNAYVTPKHRKFLHDSIHKGIIIREHESNNTAWKAIDFSIYDYEYSQNILHNVEVWSNKMQTSCKENGTLVCSIHGAAYTLNRGKHGTMFTSVK
jgi:hypothetical protein